MKPFGLFITLIQVLFIGLKLAGIGAVAHWSWGWVLSPLWGPIALVPVIILLIVAGLFLFLLFVLAKYGFASKAKREQMARKYAKKKLERERKAELKESKWSEFFKSQK